MMEVAKSKAWAADLEMETRSKCKTWRTASDCLKLNWKKKKSQELQFLSTSEKHYDAFRELVGVVKMRRGDSRM